MWQGIFSCLVAVNRQGLLERENLGTAGKLSNAHRLLEPSPTYPKHLTELYDRMPRHFGLAVELQNLGALSSALVGQQSWACRKICGEKEAVLENLDRAKVYLKI